MASLVVRKQARISGRLVVRSQAGGLCTEKTRSEGAGTGRLVTSQLTVPTLSPATWHNRVHACKCAAGPMSASMQNVGAGYRGR